MPNTTLQQLGKRLIHAQQIAKIGLIALFAIWLAINLPALVHYPAPHSDEAWFGSTGVSLLKTGENEVIVFGDTLGLYRSQNVWRLYAVTLASWFRIFGVGLLQARLLSLSATALSALLLYRLARRELSPLGGWLTVAFYLLSLRTFYTSHFTRPDALVQLWGIATWVGYLHLRRAPSWWKALLLGFACTAGADLFPIVLYFSASAGLWAFGEFCLRRDWKTARLLALGAVIGIVYFLATRLLASPLSSGNEISSVFSAYSDSNAYGFLSKGLLRYLREDIWQVIFLQGLWRHSRIAPLETISWLAGLALAIWQRKRFDWFLLGAGFFLWAGFLLPYKGLHHLTEFTPWVSLLCARFYLALGQWVAHKFPQWQNPLPLLAATPLLVGCALGGILLAQRSQPIQYAQAAQTLRSYLPANANLLGEGTWFWYLPAASYTSDEFLRIFQDGNRQLSPNEIVTQVIRQHQVDTILLDEHFSYHEYAMNQDLQDALESYVATHCHLSGETAFPGYGVETGGPAPKQVRVYQCP